MLTVTEAAGAYLEQLLDKTATDDKTAVRIVPATQGNLALQFDIPRPDDTTFEHDGQIVLVLDARIAQRLTESTLDMQDADEGSKLVLRTLAT